MSKLLKTMAFICVGATMFLLGTFAANNNVPGESVYVSETDRIELLEIIQNSDALMGLLRYYGVYVLPESITQVYTADLSEYAETGVFRIEPQFVPSIAERLRDDPSFAARLADTIEVNPNFADYHAAHLAEQRDDPLGLGGNRYYAKAVTADGLFGGNIWFYIENGIARSSGFTPSGLFSDYNHSVFSFSYADHARRIQELLGRDSFVPVEQVRYVGGSGLGTVFYINDGEMEALVLLSSGGKGNIENVFNDGVGGIVYLGDNLQHKAEAVIEKSNERMREWEEWQAENPGQILIGGGVSAPTIAPNPSAIDDITDISAYLGDAWVIPQTGEGGGVSLQVLLGFVGVFALMGAGAVVYFRK
jgi:hypothetical protein